MTRRRRLVLLVTDMVIRPSPIPSAWTETSPCRMASRRSCSGTACSVPGLVLRVGRGFGSLGAGLGRGILS